MQAALIRDEVSSMCVRGALYIDGYVFQILERPWLNNRRNISCIPTGKYTANFLPRSVSGKYKNVFHLTNVSGRSGILIHNGNVVDHTKGCLIIGLKRGRLAGKSAVLNSRTALSKLVEITQKQTFELTIIGNQKIQSIRQKAG